MQFNRKWKIEQAPAIVTRDRFMKFVTDNIPAMVAYWTNELRCRFANGVYLEWFGRTPDEMIGIRIQDLLGDELFRKNEPYIRAALRGERQQFERTLTKADGSTGYTWAQYIPDVENGHVNGFFVLVSDITPLKEAQMALAESEWKLRTIIETDPECVAILSRDGKVQQINPAGLEIVGAVSANQIVEAGFVTLIDPRYQEAFNSLIANVGRGDSGALIFELIGLTGRHRWLDCRAVPMRNKDNGIVGSLCVIRDITDRKIAEQKLEHFAHTDYLTNLANRRHFMEIAEQELLRSRRYGGPLSILMIDIDHFKRINDTYGHKAGGAVLQSFADLCRTSLRTLDIVGRLGGEEFAVLLPQTDQGQALEVAEHLRRRIDQCKVHAECEEAIVFTVSIGISGSVDGRVDIDTLISQADKALYKAKNSGRNKICEYKASGNPAPPGSGHIRQ